MSISSILNITSDRNDNGSNTNISNVSNISSNDNLSYDELVFSDDDPEYLMEIDALIRHTLNTTTITTVSASLQPDKSKTIFKCKVPRCEKVFNSLGYLNKHQCLKHPENDT
ncbi:6592_t:CDS:2 [Entrophospora sp. SA101]|nr:6592_t:CDS:2 [Entrophospora sp. SA101]